MSDVRRSAPALEVRGLDVYYGHSHALQGVDLTLESGVFSVVGRNGMGKTTLCKTIMGLLRASGGAIRLRGQDITSMSPAGIARLGVGYVPQGRRLWRSLSVDEHLRLAAGIRRGPWSVERIYDTFPRLGERKNHGGGQLSGGEQQMLAISRALLTNPHLLVMDEPTEGLAPVIVAQVEEMLVRLSEEDDISVLVIEQNIGVATANQLPQFTITAALGTAATGFTNMFAPGTGVWSIAGGITQTLFDAGTLLHKKRAAVAAFEQTAAQYRSTVIKACQNVADALRTLQGDADAMVAQAAAEHSAAASLDLARRQYQLGAIDYLTLLNAQRTWQQARISLVQAEANRFADTAALFQALGGGWWHRSDATRVADNAKRP